MTNCSVEISSSFLFEGSDENLSDNWVVQNLQNALETWNEKLAEIWSLLTQSPQSFKGGSIWSVILSIHGTLQAIGYALLVLFFVTGIVSSLMALKMVSERHVRRVG